LSQFFKSASDSLETLRELSNQTVNVYIGFLGAVLLLAVNVSIGLNAGQAAASFSALYESPQSE